jgi:hypothetical protein
MTIASSPRCIFLGKLTRDFFILPDGQVKLDEPGGDLLYAASGYRLWETETPPGMVARVGEDYPYQWLERIQARGMDGSGIHILPEAVDVRTFYTCTAKSVQVSEDPVAQFAKLGQPYPKGLMGYRVPQRQYDSRTQLTALSLRRSDLPEEYLHATAAHLCPLDYLTHTLMPALFRQSGFTTISLDPSYGSMTPMFWDDIPAIVTGLTAFISSEEKVRNLFHGRSSDLWEMAETLAGYGCEFVVIKRGERGQMLYDSGARLRWEIPSYAARVANPAGAGSAFSGGFMADYRRSFDPLQAVLHGNIAASLVVEGTGPFYALDALPGLAEARLQALKEFVRKI